MRFIAFENKSAMRLFKRSLTINHTMGRPVLTLHRNRLTVKINRRRVVYRKSDVIAWMESKHVNPTNSGVEL